MTNQQSERLKHLKKEVNAPKSALIHLLREVDTLSCAQARKLERIIQQLETWQNS